MCQVTLELVCADRPALLLPLLDCFNRSAIPMYVHPAFQLLLI